MIKCILLTSLFCFFSIFALAADGGGGWKSPFSSPDGMQSYREKAEEKANNRWTLADWLAQKERNHMMDLWLGMYSPSPYELIIGGFYDDYTLRNDNPVTQNQRYSMGSTLAFYSLALGLEAFYENNWNEAYVDSGANIGVRIAGRAVQNTHLILQYGVRNKKSANFTLQQQYVGLDLDIYVERHSGIHGNYRYYLPTTETTLGNVNGRRWEAGLFFDIGFVKLFGNWYSDLQTNQGVASTLNQDRSGINSGAKFFF